MSTVEAIQVHLADVGYVLYPGSPEDPPRKIYEENLVEMHAMIFYTPNPNGPVFVYDRDPSTNSWFHRDAAPEDPIDVSYHGSPATNRTVAILLVFCCFLALLVLVGLPVFPR